MDSDPLKCHIVRELYSAGFDNVAKEVLKDMLVKVKQTFLLYIPTQIRFPIGGKRVTCRGSKDTNSLGRTNLTNSLRKQQHELSTCT